MVYSYGFLRPAFLKKILIHGLSVVFMAGAVGVPIAFADPPVGAFYYPPGNIPPGPPPNYNQVDTSYFMGVPDIPLPPPDSGGVYIWVDDSGAWNIANHIYSRGNSLEQFHGSVLALLDSPPTPGVNVFATDFELFGDTISSKCYKQNDRWGWYQWAENLYEIWWDVCTREWNDGQGDPNDFMRIVIIGCAIDYNVWSSGHSGNPFGTDQIYLGASMTRLSDVPGFVDTYPGISDPYQSQAGTHPDTDPNITIFTTIEGTGASYNRDGVIIPGQTYPCGPILGQDYGDRFAGTSVYEGNGVQFSSSCLSDPCASNNPPVTDSPNDTTVVVCNLGLICLPGFTCTDPDNNLLSLEVTGGTLNGDTVCFVPSEGVNVITIIGADECGAADTSVTQVTVVLDGPPIISCPASITIDCAASTNPINTGFATAADDHDPAPAITYSDVQNGDVLTRTWTATDGCGSTDQCLQTITLVDSTAPLITCSPDVTVQCSSEIPAADVGSVTVSDNCDPTPVITHVSDVSDGNSCPEMITRTYRATDDAGNFSDCTQLIIIHDTTAPVINCPPNIAIGCDDPSDPAHTGTATATDNCAGNPEITYSDSWNDNVLTRTWFATDLCSNIDQCSQIITIEGTEPPQVDCPGDTAMLVCDLNEEICIDGFSYSDPDGQITGVSVNVGYIDGGTVCFVPVEGPNEIILSVTDDCGLVAQCATIITVTLNSPPEICCITDTSVIITHDWEEQICLPGICFNDPDDNIMSIEITGGIIVGDEICFVPAPGINTITLTCTDSCGSADVCEITVIAGSCDYTPGDVNSDDFVNGIDITYMANYFTNSGPPPPDTCDCRPPMTTYPFYGAGDTNGDCLFSGSDAIHLVNYLLRGTVESVLFCPDCPPTGGWIPLGIRRGMPPPNTTSLGSQPERQRSTGE